MKRVIFIAILTLLAISSGFANGYPAEEAEHWEKVRQLEQLADRFKAETGFTGRVDKDNSRSCLSYIRGRFADISFSNLSDTLAIRQSLDAVIEKVLPYMGFEVLTLTKTRVGYNTSGVNTTYQQMVHGYSFEHSGFIGIGYSRDSDDVTISNGIVYTSIPPIHANYSFAQAVEIARQYYISAFGYPDTLSFKNPKRDDPPVIGEIIYETIKYVGTKYVYDKGNYRLCHIFGISVPYGVAGYRVAYIDAHTGEVYKIYDDSIEFTNCSVHVTHAVTWV